MNNWKLDQAITDVKYIDEDPVNGAIITIKNMKEIPMPVTLEITTISDNKIRKTLPVDIWKKNVEWSFIVESNEAYEKIVIDPDFDYPDVNANNNYWRNPK